MLQEPDVCRVGGCNGIMKLGMVYQESLVASSDFADTPIDRGCTMNPSGNSDMVTAMKCEQCGHSFVYDHIG